MELVSVIIPCYNQGEYIEECIESVENQTYKNIEIIVVNDGSTDNYTNKILDKIYKEKRINLIIIDNNGVSNARNVGIQNSKGTYILPLDGDDKIHSEYIEKCVDILTANKADIVYCICRLFGEKNKVLYVKDFSVDIMLHQNVVFCSAMFKRRDFDESNGYKNNMKYGFEDWDFWLSMIEKNKKFYRINEILFFYRIKSKSRSTELEGDITKYYETINQVKANHKELFSRYENLYKKNIIFLNLKNKLKTLIEFIKIFLYAHRIIKDDSYER